MRINRNIILGTAIIGSILLLSSCSTLPRDINQASRGFSKNFSGAVLVVDEGKDVFHESYGVPATGNSKFRIGSVSKTFIAASISLLVDRNLLKYDQKIDGFFPGLKYANEISIENLMEHRSGLTDFSGKEWHGFLSRSISKEEVLSYALAHKKVKKPNAEYRYSNINYILLGSIIEKTARQDVNDFIKETILVPLGMDSTGYSETDANISGLVRGSYSGAIELPGDYSINYSMLVYSGGLYSTLDDLRKWCKEFDKPKVLPAWYVEDPKGWVIGEKFDRSVQYHFGNVPAYSALVLVIRDAPESYYVVLSNEGNNKMNPAIKILPSFVYRNDL